MTKTVRLADDGACSRLWSNVQHDPLVESHHGYARTERDAVIECLNGGSDLVDHDAGYLLVGS